MLTEPEVDIVGVHVNVPPKYKIIFFYFSCVFIDIMVFIVLLFTVLTVDFVLKGERSRGSDLGYFLVTEYPSFLFNKVISINFIKQNFTMFSYDLFFNV